MKNNRYLKFNDLIKFTNIIQLFAVGSIFFFSLSCKRIVKAGADNYTEQDTSRNYDKPVIRNISFYGTGHDVGVEINGEKAFFLSESSEIKRSEIPYSRGVEIIDKFYAISEFQKFVGLTSSKRDASLSYLIRVYDEKPEYYTEEWTDYIIPKNQISKNPMIQGWSNEIWSLKK